MSKRPVQNFITVGANATTPVGRLIHPAACVRWSHPDLGDFLSFNGYYAVVLRQAGEEPLGDKIPTTYRVRFGDRSETLVSGSYTSRPVDTRELSDAYLTYLGFALNTIAHRQAFVEQYRVAGGEFREVLEDEFVIRTLPDWQLIALEKFYRRCRDQSI